MGLRSKGNEANGITLSSTKLLLTLTTPVEKSGKSVVNAFLSKLLTLPQN